MAVSRKDLPNVIATTLPGMLHVVYDVERCCRVIVPFDSSVGKAAGAAITPPTRKAPIARKREVMESIVNIRGKCVGIKIGTGRERS